MGLRQNAERATQALGTYRKNLEDLVEQEKAATQAALEAQEVFNEVQTVGVQPGPNRSLGGSAGGGGSSLTQGGSSGRIGGTAGGGGQGLGGGLPDGPRRYGARDDLTELTNQLRGAVNNLQRLGGIHSDALLRTGSR